MVKVLYQRPQNVKVGDFSDGGIIMQLVNMFLDYKPQGLLIDDGDHIDTIAIFVGP